VIRWFRILPLAALAAFAVAATAGPRTYQIDQAHSEVGFDIRHFFAKVHGRFDDYSGTIVFDPANLAASTVEVAIRDSSIDTAHEKRDKHLRSQDFFWVEKYPALTFKSTKVIPGPDSSHFQVAGVLTIRGITKPVTLDVEYLGMGRVAIGGNSLGTQAGFTATTTVNRKDWGIVWNRTLDQGGTLLGDEVAIVLKVAAGSPDPPQPEAATTPAPAGDKGKR